MKKHVLLFTLVPLLALALLVTPGFMTAPQAHAAARHSASVAHVSSVPCSKSGKSHQSCGGNCYSGIESATTTSNFHGMTLETTWSASQDGQCSIPTFISMFNGAEGPCTPGSTTHVALNDSLEFENTCYENPGWNGFNFKVTFIQDIILNPYGSTDVILRTTPQIK